MALTILQVLEETVARVGQAAALRYLAEGVWRAVSWTGYREQAYLVAKALLALGLEPGDGVAILGRNCPEWFFTDIGAIAAGGVPAGIYTTSSPEQCRYIVDHCEAPIVVVENAEQLAKLRQVRAELPKLRKMVLMFGRDDDPDVLSFNDLPRLARTVSDAALQARIDAQEPEDPATLIYTSGTTGPPKAVMLSHHNITWTTQAILSQISPPADEHDAVVSYLPLSHIAEQVVSLHGTMAAGACSWFAESLEQVGEVLQVARPTIFLAVPRVWEKIQAKITAAGRQSTGLKKRIAAWARRVGLQGGYAEQRGLPRPLLYPLADKLVFSQVRAKLGLQRGRLLMSSAAPISRDTLDFFLSLGIRICECYGMSECTGPVTLAVPQRYKTGKAGYILPGTEMKVAADGELCIRGPHVFLGYYKDEAATKEALDEEGWLHSGDVGCIDQDSFVEITDRKKELIITAGGKNVAPQLIESHLKAIPVVAQAVVVGNRRKHLSALITLDPERIAAEGIAGVTDVATAARSEPFKQHLQRLIDEVNRKLSRVEGIRKLVILERELTIDGGELTPTMKLKRRVIDEKYAKEIETLYD